MIASIPCALGVVKASVGPAQGRLLAADCPPSTPSPYPSTASRAQVDGYKRLLAQQRDIMTALTARVCSLRGALYRGCPGTPRVCSLRGDDSVAALALRVSAGQTQRARRVNPQPAGGARRPWRGCHAHAPAHAHARQEGWAGGAAIFDGTARRAYICWLGDSLSFSYTDAGSETRDFGP